MGLIKAANAPVSLQPFSMRDIEDEAQQTLVRAREQAERLLAAAQAEAEELCSTAKSRGFTEGREQGLCSGREEGLAAGTEQALAEHRSSLTHLITALNSATTQIEQSRRQLVERADTEVLRLAIAIAGKVTRRQGALDSGVLTENLITAIKLVVHSTDLRIAVHTSQRQTLLDLLPKLALNWPNFNHAELVEDANLAPGGCRIFTRAGLIDADLDEQLNRIAADLLPSPEPAAASTPSPFARGEGSSPEDTVA